MDNHKLGELQDIDVASMKVLFSVVAASFVTLGVIVYMFGDDQEGAMSAAANPPIQMTERAMRNRFSEPNAMPATIGHGVQP